ncbi:hypothetical protein SASPL_138720 [Salvia splendens]|uniref:V-type proton ATPase subunit C n=1 Tax=Salvia splendens TaxID=180675 RepID=A0A8X8ZEJ8_SALSN|nr:hypothetical protein SASPL_138720 [Salvia splendens]
MATRYWVASLPVGQGASASSVWTRLQESISKQAFDTSLYRFNIPNLRVGTLDLLLSLSDDLSKASKQLYRGSVTQNPAFVWDEAKYPTMSPLKEIVDGIHIQIAKIEDDLKYSNADVHARSLYDYVSYLVRVAEYSNVRSQLNAINRKQAGSLAVRDLSNLVKPEDVVSSEHLTTLLAIVSKYSQKDWLSSYESLTSYVVPRSSKKLHEDNEYALYTVTLFSRDVDNFKTKARERNFQVRDFEYNPETQDSRKQELEKLMQDQETMRSSLLQWCYTSYGEVFSSWMHFCASVVLSPPVKSEKKVRSILEGMCSNSNSTFWKTEDDGGVVGLGAGEADAHPYVSFTINLI